MFRNYLLTSLRTLRRNPVYSLITIFGFAVGLAAFIIIFLYIKSELSYDRSWPEKGRIYRLTENLNMSGKEDPFALTSLPVGPSLEENVPGIETVVRFPTMGQQNLRVENEYFKVDDIYMADEDFYRIFNYTFVLGDPETALKEPQSIALSEREAKRLFGDQNPLGKIVETTTKKYKVTGVFKTDDFTSHFVPNALMSINSLSKEAEEMFNSDWFRLISYTYILASENTTREELEAGIARWTKNTIDPWVNEHELSASAGFKIQPVEDVHFNTSLQYDLPGNTSRKYIYIFGAIGLFIILIASINYMNLATAKSIRRAREIGIRKVAGAGKKQLILQFLGEAVIYSFLSLIIALIFIELFTPVFNDLSGKSLSLFHDTPGMSLWLTWLQVIVIVLLVGIFSGSFPAFILSGFRPVHVLKGASANAVIRTKFINTTWVRKALVVLQFTISVAMIISTWVVFSQLQHMRYRDLGFNKENIVVVNFPSDTALTAKREVIKNELLKNANISRVSTTNNLPGYTHGRLLFFVDEQGEWKNQTMNLFVVDDDFDDLLDLQVNEGRFFSRDFAHDDTAAFVVNEATVKFLGLEQPVGHKMKCGLGVNGKIVGVISNFHYASLQKPVEPLVLIYKSNWIDMLAIRVNMENFGETIQFIEEKWTAFDQKNAFSFSFLDANFDSQYDKERKLLNIFGYFAILIIIISSMGLFGLASFTAAQRTREIGIRKVLGSSESQITGQLIKDFLLLVLVAGIIAIPVSYFAMQLWLDAFAYRISLDWTFFAGSLLLAMAIAVFTVLFQALKAARSNPVDVLKYE